MSIVKIYDVNKFGSLSVFYRLGTTRGMKWFVVYYM